jgi:hypothetical protein
MDEPVCAHCGTPMDLYDTVKLVSDLQGRFRCSVGDCGVCGGRCLERATVLLPAA